MTADPSNTDELLHAAKAGDEAALAALFNCHRDRLERMVALRLDRRLQKRVDPADILQDAFLTIQQKFAKYAVDESVPFFLWIRLEVGQKLVDIHRMHLGAQMRSVGQEISLHRGGMPSVASLTLAEQLLGRISTASNADMRAELKIKVQDALNEMDSHDREILVLRHFEELTNLESARILGISPTAACNRYVRALKRLKAIFDRIPGGVEGIWT